MKKVHEPLEVASRLCRDRKSNWSGRSSPSPGLCPKWRFQNKMADSLFNFKHGRLLGTILTIGGGANVRALYHIAPGHALAKSAKFLGASPVRPPRSKRFWVRISAQSGNRPDFGGELHPGLDDERFLRMRRHAGLLLHHK